MHNYKTKISLVENVFNKVNILFVSLLILFIINLVLTLVNSFLWINWYDEFSSIITMVHVIITIIEIIFSVLFLFLIYKYNITKYKKLFMVVFILTIFCTQFFLSYYYSNSGKQHVAATYIISTDKKNDKYNLEILDTDTSQKISIKCTESDYLIALNHKEQLGTLSYRSLKLKKSYYVLEHLEF